MSSELLENTPLNANSSAKQTGLETYFSLIHPSWAPVLPKNLVKLYQMIIRQSTSLGNPQVGTGLSVGNPWVVQPAALYFPIPQVFADLGNLSAQAGTCHKYLPYLSISGLNLTIANPQFRR